MATATERMEPLRFIAVLTVVIACGALSTSATPCGLGEELGPTLGTLLVEECGWTIEKCSESFVLMEILPPGSYHADLPGLGHANALAAVYPPDCLRMVWVLPDDETMLLRHARRQSPGSGVQLLPGESRLRRRVGLSAEMAHTFLVDPADSVRFRLSGQRLTADQRKQLVERWIPDARQPGVGVEGRNWHWWKAGLTVPDLRAIELSTGVSRSLLGLADPDTAWLWFPGACTRCVVTSYAQLIREIEGDLRESGIPMRIVLAAPDDPEAEDVLRNADIRAPTYVVEDPPGEWLLERTHPTLATDPHLLIFADRGQVAAALPLSPIPGQWAAQLGRIRRAAQTFTKEPER